MCSDEEKKKRKFFFLHRVFISSEKLGVWDLCVHLVLNVRLFCFRLVLFVTLSLLFPHIITLFFISSFLCFLFLCFML